MISTLAPASSNCFWMSSASALETPSLRVLGAPSTMSLASFRPRPVIARTTLITPTFWSPAEANTTSNSVFSSAAAAPAPAGPATATAAAETPNFLQKLNQVVNSITVKEPTASKMSSLVIAMLFILQILY